MTFGEKLKKLRQDNQLTQEQLAQKIFVTRTAISKWELDKGYPSIDSLKLLSNLFHVSIDDLLSNEDVENKKLLDEANARKAYSIAIVFFVLTVVCAIVYAATSIRYVNIGTAICAVGYLVCALLAKPEYKRVKAKSNLAAWIVSRVIILAVAVIVLLSCFL